MLEDLVGDFVVVRVRYYWSLDKVGGDCGQRKNI